MAQIDINQIKSLLDSARSVALLLPKTPTYDSVAAALGLKLSLEQAGKTVTVASPDPMTVEVNRMVGINTITQSFGKRDLVIAFPGQTEMVDKVSYNVDHGELQLVVTPKAGTPGFDPSKLKFVAGGPQADVVLFFDVSDPATDLGQIWTDAREFLQNAKQYSIHSENYSETIGKVISDLQLPMSPDSASNLLAGLEQASNLYQTATPEMFEIAANLLRHGARHHDVYAPSDVVPGTVPQSTTPMVSPTIQNQPDQTSAPQPQEDWYEPKVYRGTNLS